MSYWILPLSGRPIVCSTVQHITKDEARDPKYQELLLSYDKQIDKTVNFKDKDVDLTGLKPWDLIDIDFPTQEFSADAIPEADEFDVFIYDKYVGARVDMSRGGDQGRPHHRGIWGYPGLIF